MDDNTVQPTGDVSQETPSIVSEAPTPEPTQPQTLTEDILKQRIDEALNKALGEHTEKAKREIQSIKDKSKTEIEALYRRANIAETTLQGIIPELDEETRNKLELQRLRGTVAQHQTKDQEEETRRQAEEFYQTFDTQMTEFITEAGVDPSDKRIDWARDAKDGFEMQKRIHSSVAKILKEEKKVTDEKRSQEIKDLEMKLRKDLGLDSVDTTNPVAPQKDVSKYTASDWIKEGLKEGQKKK
jgi:hypothetical protein